MSAVDSESRVSQSAETDETTAPEIPNEENIFAAEPTGADDSRGEKYSFSGSQLRFVSNNEITFVRLI